MIRTYKEAVKFLSKYNPSGKYKYPGKLGIVRMERLVGFLGNPQNSYKNIHVGGTSGKGSTATLISSILATKYKTGFHTSPHLLKINERMQIRETKNKKLETKEISNEEFVELINDMKPVVDEMEKSEIGAPSYFEIITAAAFLYFKKQKVDFAVIEVGMGGRFDATNVINPEVAVLTNVGLDHTEVLGDTVEEIARDKAGIIKPGIKVVTGVKQDTVKKIIKITNNKKQIINNFLAENFKYKIRDVADKGSYFDYFGKKNYKKLFIPLLGAHQIENAALAIRATEEIYELYEGEIRIGLKNAFIPGRMEIIRRKPLVILDGAHNRDKMEALVSALKTIWPEKKVKLVLAIKEDKRAEEMLKIILPLSSEVILTKFESLLDIGKVLSYDPDSLKEIIKKISYQKKITIISDAEKALKETINTSIDTDIILVTGSLYLVGKVINKNEK